MLSHIEKILEIFTQEKIINVDVERAEHDNSHEK